jgi:hypothetical protein
VSERRRNCNVQIFERTSLLPTMAKVATSRHVSPARVLFLPRAGTGVFEGFAAGGEGGGVGEAMLSALPVRYWPLTRSR